ncbi:MAG: DUF488 domain-containing protein [archaeon]
MLRTKSILAPRESFDGVRISVMSRHTLNDGITPHPQITDSNYILWLQILAPPIKLVGDYYKRNLPWEQFAEKYLQYIRQGDAKREVQSLAERSLHHNITFLCIEDSPENCHRRLLAEECKRYEPSLALSIL